MTLTTLLIRIGIASIVLTMAMFFGIIKTRRATALVGSDNTTAEDMANYDGKQAFRKPGNFIMSLFLSLIHI